MKKLLAAILFLSALQARAVDSSYTAPDASFTTGTHPIIEILAQFSDLPSTYTQAQLSASVDAMCSFFHDSSYGKLTFVPTVTRYYTLPHPSSYYEASGKNILSRDLIALASADYGDVAAKYDHIICWFPRIKIGFSAWGQIPGNTVWINGAPGAWITSHELGHNLGLGHAHRWQPCDPTNPIDSCGKALEYGDGFDMMGGQGAGHDFNPWEKKRMHWLGNEQTKPVTASGIYRIHRFDSAAAKNFTPLALTIPQPGNTGRTYNISYRHNIKTTMAGAYVGWQTARTWQLIDYNSLTTGLQDAVVPVGSTLRDNGLAISTVATGGTEPDCWVDVQITIP